MGNWNTPKRSIESYGLEPKTIIAGITIALMGIGATTIVVDELLPVPGIQGTWEGTLDLPGNGVHTWGAPKTRLVLRIAVVNGAYQARLDNIGGGVQDQVVTCNYQYPFLHGEVSSTVDDFSFFVGKVSRFGERMTWNSWENNQAFPPAVFRRTTHPPPFPEPLTEAEFAPRAGSALQGFWAGTIGREKEAIHVQFKITEAAGGTFRADFYDPDQAGTNRFPTTASYDGTTVKLMPMNGYGMLEGWLRDGGKEIVGNWIQNDTRTTTTLTRENYSDYEAQRAK